MQTYNQMGQNNIMPLLINFNTPSPIQEYIPEIFNYDETNQISYEMRVVGTRCLRSVSTRVNPSLSRFDKKNEIDDSKSVR